MIEQVLIEHINCLSITSHSIVYFLFLEHIQFNWLSNTSHFCLSNTFNSIVYRTHPFELFIELILFRSQSNHFYDQHWWWWPHTDSTHTDSIQIILGWIRDDADNVDDRIAFYLSRQGIDWIEINSIPGFNWFLYSGIWNFILRRNVES